jgi:hypothetical protein
MEIQRKGNSLKDFFQPGLLKCTGKAAIQNSRIIWFNARFIVFLYYG